MKLLLVLSVISLAFPVQATGQPVPGDSSGSISLELPETTLGEALRSLFALRPDIGFDMPDELASLTSPPTVLRDVLFESALRAILSRSECTATLSGDSYLIATRLPEPVIDTPRQPESKRKGNPVGYGHSRYEVENAVGKPDRIEYKRTPGHELWHYPDFVVEFVNCRVSRISAPMTLAVSAGRQSSRAPAPPQRNTGSEWVSGLRNYLNLLSSGLGPGLSSTSYSYFSYSRTVTYSVSDPMPSIGARPVMFNSSTGAPILWQ